MKTRYMLLREIKEFFNNKILLRKSKEESECLFINYFNENKLFECYEFDEGYALFYTELIYGYLNYLVLVTDLDTEHSIYEFEFDDRNEFLSFVKDTFNIKF